jgi:hypothetical protein
MTSRPEDVMTKVRWFLVPGLVTLCGCPFICTDLLEREVSLDPEGHGRIVGEGLDCLGTPAGIGRSGECRLEALIGNQLNFTAVAEEGWGFVRWIGCDEIDGDRCVAEARDEAGTLVVTAVFEPAVDCDHEGAGGDFLDSCACAEGEVAIAGEWSERYLCRADACFEENLALFTISEDTEELPGVHDAASPGEGWDATGRVCDDIYEWETTETTDAYFEVGTWFFVAEDRFEKYSEYWDDGVQSGPPDGVCVGIAVRGTGDPPALSELTVVEQLDCTP